MTTTVIPNTDPAGVLNREFRGALFDMDGTLIDSTPAVVRSWATLAEEWDIATELYSGTNHGRPARELLASILPAEQVDDALARITHLEITDTDGVIPLPGALTLVRSLPPHAWTIVTSSTGPLADVRLESAGIPSPDALVTVDDVVDGKPDPEPFETGAARLGVHPEDCIAFEDSPAGLRAARDAGCITVGVPGTHDLDQLDADITLTSLEKLRVETFEGSFRLRIAD